VSFALLTLTRDQAIGSIYLLCTSDGMADRYGDHWDRSVSFECPNENFVSYDILYTKPKGERRQSSFVSILDMQIHV